MYEAQQFGRIAQKKGFVTTNDLEYALHVQKEMEARGEPPKLLGIVMLELGMLSSDQLLEILRQLEKGHGIHYY